MSATAESSGHEALFELLPDPGDSAPEPPPAGVVDALLAHLPDDPTDAEAIDAGALYMTLCRTSWFISDTDYVVRIQRGELDPHDEERWASASVDQLRSLFTFFVRTERFIEGAFACACDDGTMSALLRRLRELRNEGCA